MACQTAGPDAEWVRGRFRPLCSTAALGCREPAPVRPDAAGFVNLIDELHARDGLLLEGIRVHQVVRRRRRRVEAFVAYVPTASEFEPFAHIDACWPPGFPILDRGGFFARLTPHRSYCMAFRVRNMTRGMYISADSPTRSVRYAPTVNGDRSSSAVQDTWRGAVQQRIDVGAGAGVVGELARGDTEYYWSAQDYALADELPYVGPILPGHDKIAGNRFRQMGHDQRAAAALALSSTMLWPDGLGRGVRQLESARAARIPAAMRGQPEVALNLAKADRTVRKVWATAAVRTTAVWSAGLRGTWRRAAIDGGAEHRASPVCPHLGGSSTGTTPTKPGECLLHGFLRFAPDGTLLEGPATRNLTAAD